jgi:hypothetical protein
MRDGSRARWRRVDKRRHRKSVDNFDFIFYWTKLNLLCFLSLGGWVGLPNTQSTNKQSRREREREKRSNSGTLEIGAGSFVFVFLLLFCFYQCVSVQGTGCRYRRIDSRWAFSQQASGLTRQQRKKKLTITKTTCGSPFGPLAAIHWTEKNDGVYVNSEWETTTAPILYNTYCYDIMTIIIRWPLIKNSTKFHQVENVNENSHSLSKSQFQFCDSLLQRKKK